MSTPIMETNTIIIDNGTGNMKVGNAGHDAPNHIFKTLIGKRKYPGVPSEFDNKKEYIGEGVYDVLELVTIDSPIKGGIIEEFEDMEKIWNHSIYSLMKTTPEEQPFIFTEPPLNPKEKREKITQAMFETFRVPAFYLGVQGVFSLFASGKTTGLIVDSGEGVTHTIPIYEGFSIPGGVSRIPIAGGYLTEFFQELLMKLGYKMPPNSNPQIVAAAKEQNCDVALNYEDVLAKHKKDMHDSHEMTLPDGKSVVGVSIERWEVPEVLFQPRIGGKDYSGIHKHAEHSIKQCDEDIKPEMYKNIVLAGGSTMFPTMGERFKKEMRKISDCHEVNIYAPPKRKISAWVGASIVASLCTFPPMYITMGEYLESGVSIVHSKCF